MHFTVTPEECLNVMLLCLTRMQGAFLQCWVDWRKGSVSTLVSLADRVSLLAMDDSSSLGKVSSSTESVATVTSEEFVLVQPNSAGSPQGSEGKPRLKVRAKHQFDFFLHLNQRSP